MDSCTFAFGKVYTLVKGISFEKSINKEDLKDMYDTHSRYEVNKNNFMLEAYTNFDSMVVNYSRYMSYILEEEKTKEKDLYEYNTDELVDLMSTVTTSSMNVKASLWVFIKQYLTWCVGKGYCQYNMSGSIADDEVIKVNTKMLNKKIISIKQFDELCEDMVLAGVPIFHFTSVILARYGIIGEKLESMINLKWDDIDRNNMSVRIVTEDGELTTEVPVDNIFLKWIDRAKAEQSFGDLDVVDNGYVIKVSNYIENRANEKSKFSTIYGNYKKAFEQLKTDKIAFGDLLKSRMLDLLLEMRKRQRLTTGDILDVIRIYKPDASNGAYNSLKREYEALTGDKVLKVLGLKQNELIDENSKETVKEIRKKLFGEG